MFVFKDTPLKGPTSQGKRKGGFGMTGELEIPLSWRSAWLEQRETLVVLLLARRQLEYMRARNDGSCKSSGSKLEKFHWRYNQFEAHPIDF